MALRAAIARPVAAAAAGVRRMSVGASQEEAISTFELWKKVGLGGIALCGVVGIYDLATDEHAHKHVWYPHEKIRTKRFPWDAKDCDLLDLHCKHEFFHGKSEDGGH
eukprot:CAMPEP_0203806634 /NCGR_PEP_ID=MMETSP0115-20131106/599_1 /ASSEMBLY_ACC=CAM_ASM_000227 /TAXON_ID=33651 /ORGANISM="Bicosoecid sp, Strain ms1" /LENGTH=106 /DNA_ID=CAMNT_0050715297 /DNA_START=23 /DNA_END=343 /DNA_ORIENTATION=+